MIPLFAVLVVLPVADELIGGFQFRALCKENAVLKIDAQKIKGKTIREVPVPLIGTQDMTQTAVRIYFYRIGYRDSVSGEEFASYVSYTAMGGLLVSALGMSNDIAPLTIHPSSCKPRNVGDLSKEFDFKFTPNRK